MKITIKKGSIVKEEVDAIVNPANSFGHMGGGVASVLKGIGGEEIEEEAIELAPTEIGDAIFTGSGDLICGAVIHAPTMREPAEKTDAQCVELATEAALNKAEELECRIIAMPGMGTGVGRVPHEEAAKAMMTAINAFEGLHLKEVILIDIDEEMVQAWNGLINH